LLGLGGKLAGAAVVVYGRRNGRDGE